MRYITALFICFCFSSNAQEKLFVGTNETYSIKLDSIAERFKDASGRTFDDLYVVRRNNNKSPELFISVRLIGIEVNDKKVIYTVNFKKGYKESCRCDVLASERKQFKNFEATQFTMTTNFSGHPVKGFSVAVANSIGLFNITILTNVDTFPALEGRLLEIVNTISFTDH